MAGMLFFSLYFRTSRGSPLSLLGTGFSGTRPACRVVIRSPSPSAAVFAVTVLTGRAKHLPGPGPT